MKKAEVTTTAARGTAVSRSKITAVQSVYMGGLARRKPPFQQVSCSDCPGTMDWMNPMPGRMPQSPRPGTAPGPISTGLLIAAVLLPLGLCGGRPGHAGVRFDNCVSAADGSISCDTVPTGNTLADDEAARFGLFDNASPGWSEFDPYAGYEDDFGGNQS